ncbi:MAG: DUF3575 domain-containing protein [Cyclobacteriaceae bacterium]|nr:DUF3575 domain-containing protein [Cyclobacteriaceae bacterium]
MKAIFLTLGLLLNIAAFGQDSVRAIPDRRNTIKIDLTSHWLYRQAWVVSYERVINNRRSWQFTVGYQQFPPISHFGAIANVTKDINAQGLKLAGEYRFYLARENKFAAPHGIYLGPYLSFNNFSNKRDIVVATSSGPEPVSMDSRFDIINVGIQLGYQFVFKDRWTIDLSFMGPSISNYRAQFDLSGNYTFNPDDVTNEIIKDLITRFPGLSDFLSSGSLSKNGKVDTWAYGYRYQIQVGYRFGGKKKSN